MVCGFEKLMESWSVSYTFLGWSYCKTYDMSLQIMCNARQAFYIMRAIQRAAAICAMRNNLRRMEGLPVEELTIK